MNLVPYVKKNFYLLLLVLIIKIDFILIKKFMFLYDQHNN